MVRKSMSKSWHNEARGRLEQFCRDTLAPAPDEPVWKWAERNCYVRGDNEGAYSTTLTPYAREPLEGFKDKQIEDLTLCFAAQVAKTTIVMAGTSWLLVNDPRDTLWVMPDKELGGSFSRNRWMPWVDDCRPLADLKPGSRILWTTREQRFARAALFFVGSNSASQISSRPCGCVLMDECDKFGLRNDREAGALKNAEERTKSFTFPKRVKTSTPTIQYGEIWQEFLKGDQRYYWVPCPHCQTMIRLLWKQVRWWDKEPEEAKTGGDWDMEKVRRNTHYVCQECEQKFTDVYKPGILLAGEWRANNPMAEKTRRSYHLSALYAPWKQTRWGNLAVRWLQSKATLDGRQNFVNSTLAEPWDGENAYDEEPVPTEAYVPAEMQRDRVPLMTIDVQRPGFWVVIRAWSKTGESWLLYAGYVETIEECDQLQTKYAVNPNMVMIDCADQTNLVSRWIVDRDWRGAWGSSKQGFVHSLPNGNRVQRLVSPVQWRDPFLGTVQQSERNNRARYVYWANDPVKDILAVMRHAEPRRWHVHGDIPPEYTRHLNAEIKIMKQNPRTGRYQVVWKQVRKDNHLLDCEAMQVVDALCAGVIQEDHEKYANAQGALKLHEVGGR